MDDPPTLVCGDCRRPYTYSRHIVIGGNHPWGQWRPRAVYTANCTCTPANPVRDEAT